jgi:hypothetical protein
MFDNKSHLYVDVRGVNEVIGRSRLEFRIVNRSLSLSVTFVSGVKEPRYFRESGRQIHTVPLARTVLAGAVSQLSSGEPDELPSVAQLSSGLGTSGLVLSQFPLQ